MFKIKKHFIVIFACFSCTQKQAFKQYKGFALGTTFSISVSDYAGVEHFPKQLDSIFVDINASLSTYQENSRISRYNKGERIQLDEDFLANFLLSKQLYQETEGYFNPALQPVLQWYQTDKQIPLNQVLAYTAFDSIALVETEEGVFLQGNKKYALNFNAIAKGYIVQKIGDFLARRGAENYMVEIGGEIALKGLNSDGKPWQIAIEKPILTEKSAQAILSLTDISMATSGNYKQFIESNGEKRSHIINSKTGLPEHSSLIAVTVLHVDCAVADAWATAIMAMGEAKAKELLGQNTDLSVFWISKDEENNLTTAYFNNFDKFMLKNVAK